MSVQPGDGNIVEVPLGADTTAGDVVDFCTKGETDSWWILVADLNGQFPPLARPLEVRRAIVRRHYLTPSLVDLKQPAASLSTVHFVRQLSFALSSRPRIRPAARPIPIVDCENKEQ